jgi:predicted glycogen debranching enzyme
VTSLLPHLRNSVRAHVEGTLFGIKTDDDGLLGGGEPGVQLTWMDAIFKGEVITARKGKPVEINALWYNALKVMAEFCGAFGGLAEERKYDQMASRVSRAFNKKFWNDEKGCLYDCIDAAGKDDSVRPNQVIAISLTYPVLDTSRWKPLMEVVERELLTPYGLRTLSPNDPRYRGTYEGDLEARDKAYHQGTVWAWLLGPFIKAYLRTHSRSDKTLAFCTRLVEGFEEHLSEAGLGQVSEIFDGDPPHKPRGCIAQAWSVAALLRVIAEDLTPRPAPALGRAQGQPR